MCYLCRCDVQDQQYEHFCQHFRPFGGRCTQCSKCELFFDPSNGAQVQEIQRGRVAVLVIVLGFGL